MKSVLLVICAAGYGLIPSLAGFQTPALLVVLGAILLGLIFFVLHTKDWPAPLVPWLLACIVAGRTAAYWWLNARHARNGPIFDSEVLVFGGLATVCFAFVLYRWMRDQNENPGLSPKST
jgi:hypothetical protein